MQSSDPSEYEDRSSEEFLLNNRFKGQNNKNQNFQKNYPKNIMIPIIDYLFRKGFKKLFQENIVKKRKITDKNVGSLQQYYKLFNQQWFQQSIDLDLLLKSVLNTILMNSKLKNKFFDLKVAELLIKADYKIQFGDFKKIISKKAHNIASKMDKNIGILDFSSIITDMLAIFYEKLSQDFQSKYLGDFHTIKNEILKKNNHRNVPSKRKFKKNIKASRKKKCINQTQNTKNDVQKNEQRKSLQKFLIQILSKIKGNKHSFKQIEENIFQALDKRQNVLRDTHELAQGVPNYILFFQEVVKPCLISRHKSQKVTNIKLTKLINQYSNLLIQINERYQDENEAQSMSEQGESSENQSESRMKGFENNQQFQLMKHHMVTGITNSFSQSTNEKFVPRVLQQSQFYTYDQQVVKKEENQ